MTHTHITMEWHRSETSDLYRERNDRSAGVACERVEKKRGKDR